MAVYTEISSALLSDALSAFGLHLRGEPEAAADGIENTTYFFRACGENNVVRNYVLTVFEQVPVRQILFAIALTRQLAASQLPVPAPLNNRQDTRIFSLASKNALIFPRAKGRHIEQPGTEECRVLGDYLGRAHISCQALTSTLENSRGLSWLASAAEQLHGSLNARNREILHNKVLQYRGLKRPGIQFPSGAIHGDLFRDNALFENGTLCGIIDFYNACTDWFLIDVAIAVNDWCINRKTGEMDGLLAESLLEAYNGIRPFTEDEREYWPDVIEIAATRFWVSRLQGEHGHLGQNARTKEAREYRHRLLTVRNSLPPLPG